MNNDNKDISKLISRRISGGNWLRGRMQISPPPLSKFLYTPMKATLFLFYSSSVLGEERYRFWRDFRQDLSSDPLHLTQISIVVYRTVQRYI